MVQAAVNIVAERGLEELTLAECGEAAGYSRGLAAHYFGSKDALIRAIATHIVADYSKRLRSDSHHRGGLDGLLDSVSFYIESGRENGVAVRAFHAVLGSALTQAPLASLIAQINRGATVAFAATIRAGVKRGEIRGDVNPSAQAAVILASLRGVMAQWLIDPHGVPLAGIRKELIENLRRTLAA